jgi:glycosyltransferase involved in cell wall biosynthesis
VFSPTHRREAYRHALGVNSRDVLITYVGRIAREKDLDLLVQAWELLGRREEVKLALVGRGPMEAELRRLEIPGIILPGLKQDVDLSVAYASSDIFAFPSTTETFGNVLLEAMASGLPCLAAAAGGVVENARHRHNAWLVAPHSAEAIAHGLLRLLADGDLRRVLGTGARRTACDRGWDIIFDSLLTQYDRAGAGLHQAA